MPRRYIVTTDDAAEANIDDLIDASVAATAAAATAAAAAAAANAYTESYAAPIAQGFFAAQRAQGVHWVTDPTYGAVAGGTAAANKTAARAAITGAGVGGTLRFPAGAFSVDDTLDLLDSQTVILDAGCTITQTVANKQVFVATQKANVWIHATGAILYGHGGYSSAWTGMSGHADRGIEFLGCINSGVLGFPTIRNFASAGVSVRGGTNIKVQAIIEGTHEYSTAIASGNNFQVGAYVSHDATYGTYDAVSLDVIVSGTAQGILTEPIIEGEGSLVINAVIHDIPGQHGLYLQSNNITLNASVRGCALDGIKWQSGANNQNLHGLTGTAHVADCPNGQAFHLAVAGTGSLSGVNLVGTAYDCARGLTIDGKVSGRASVVAETMSQYGLYIFDAGGSDLDIDITARDVQQHGVLVNATGLTRCRIKPTLYNVGQGSTTYSGVFASACTEVVIEDPIIVDANAKMAYGIDAGTNATVKVTGTPIIRGYTTNGIRATGPVHWYASPGEFTAITTAFYNAGLGVIPFTPITIGRQTTSASNGAIWQFATADESAYLLRAELVGKLSGSAQRGAIVTTALGYRDGGSAAIEGSADTDVSILSGSFAGAASWSASGNNLSLLVNSGGVATVDWSARVSLVRAV